MFISSELYIRLPTCASNAMPQKTSSSRVKKTQKPDNHRSNGPKQRKNKQRMKKCMKFETTEATWTANILRLTKEKNK